MADAEGVIGELKNEGTLAPRPQAAGVDPAEIERVSVEMNDYEANYPGMGATGPFGSIGQTLMSTRFCVALALSGERVTVDDLMRFEDPAVLSLVERIDIIGTPARAPITAAVTIRTYDEREHLERFDGDPATVLSWDLVGAAELARSLRPRRSSRRRRSRR